jgi:hypothetical protein
MMIQNARKQDVFTQLQGYILFGAASLAPHILNHDPLGEGVLLSYKFSYSIESIR